MYFEISSYEKLLPDNFVGCPGDYIIHTSVVAWHKFCMSVQAEHSQYLYCISCRWINHSLVDLCHACLCMAANAVMLAVKALLERYRVTPATSITLIMLCDCMWCVSFKLYLREASSETWKWPFGGGWKLSSQVLVGVCLTVWFQSQDKNSNPFSRLSQHVEDWLVALPTETSKACDQHAANRSFCGKRQI